MDEYAEAIEIEKLRKLRTMLLSCFRDTDDKLEKLTLKRDKRIKKGAAKEAAKAKKEKAMKKKAIEVKLSMKAVTPRRAHAASRFERAKNKMRKFESHLLNEFNKK